MTQSLLDIQRHPHQYAQGVPLLGMGTATPAHLEQAAIAELALPRCCDDQRQRDFLERVFTHSGVTHRATVLAGSARAAAAFYTERATPADRGPTTAQRMALYAREAPSLAAEACAHALADASLSPEAITHLITVSCTGFFAPGLDIAMIQRLHLAPTVQRQHLGFMGCHGAFNALAAAQTIAEAHRQARILVCCTELCSLHLAYGFDPQRIVANALFADGAAAVVISAEHPHQRGHGRGLHTLHARLLASVSLLLPNATDAMTWTIGDHGFEMTLSPQVPPLIHKHLPDFLAGFLAHHHLTCAQIPHFAIHPGGPKILAAVADALDLPASALAASRQVLRDHGNMSSATILFVLEALRRQGATGLTLALGFGPGLMAEAMLLDL